MIGAWVIVVTAGATCLIMAAVFAIFHKSDPHKSGAAALWSWGYLVGAIAWTLNAMRYDTNGSVYIWFNNFTFMLSAMLLCSALHAYFGKKQPKILYIGAMLFWAPLYTYGLLADDPYLSFLLRSVATGAAAGAITAAATYLTYREARSRRDPVEMGAAVLYGMLSVMTFFLIPSAIAGVDKDSYFQSVNFIILYVLEPPLVVGIGMFASLMLSRRLIAELRGLADCDPLTGLLNRRGFMSRFEAIFNAAVGQGRDMALILLDIDHFKEVNSRFGHVGGDRVLVEFADIMRDCLLPGQICGRQGGEEFAVLLPDCGNDEAREYLEKLKTVLASGKIVMDGRVVQLSITSGLTTYLGEATAFEMLRRADAQLNRTRLVEDARRSTAQSKSARLTA